MTEDEAYWKKVPLRLSEVEDLTAGREAAIRERAFLETGRVDLTGFHWYMRREHLTYYKILQDKSPTE